LDRSSEEASEDHPPSRLRQVHCGWRDDQAEVENAVRGTRQNIFKNQGTPTPQVARCARLVGVRARPPVRVRCSKSKVLEAHQPPSDASLRLVGGRFWGEEPPESHIQGVWSILPISAAAAEKVSEDHNAEFLNGEAWGYQEQVSLPPKRPALSASAMMRVQQNAAQSRHTAAAE
jgi:hypothetical protein